MSPPDDKAIEVKSLALGVEPIERRLKNLVGLDGVMPELR
jgi:hypothetical protein